MAWCIKVLKALFVRLALALHAVLAVWRVTVMLDDQQWWLLACALLPFVLEGLLTIVRRNGEEFKWFTPCFFLYLCAVLPCVWLLELDKTDRYLDGSIDDLDTLEEVSNVTSSGGSVVGDVIPIQLTPNMWTILIEEFMLYLLILSRWLLPRGEVTREQLSELLFAFIAIASDIMEMFSLFGEAPVRENKYMAYWILAVWSFSVLQFCMTITVTHQPKRAKKILTIVDQTEEMERIKTRNEILAILLAMFMQDVPFVVIRLYTIVKYDLLNYSIVFFVAKNFLVIALLLYKIAILLQKRYCPEKPKDDGSEKVDEFGNIIISKKEAGKGKLIIGTDPYGRSEIIDERRLVDTTRKRGSFSSQASQGKRHRGNDYTNMIQPAVAFNDSGIHSNGHPVQPYTLPHPSGGHMVNGRSSIGSQGGRSIVSKASKGSSKSKRSQSSAASSSSKKMNSDESSKGYNSMKSTGSGLVNSDAVSHDNVSHTSSDGFSWLKAGQNPGFSGDNINTSHSPSQSQRDGGSLSRSQANGGGPKDVDASNTRF